MAEAKAVLGMMVAVGFLWCGMRALPRPGLGAVENIFTALWLTLNCLCLAAFTREAWRAGRLRAARSGCRGRHFRETIVADESAVFNRQRERRLD